MSSIALLIIIVLMASAALTGLMRVYALRRGLMDHPNARSSHEIPTPRGGGLAIVVTLVVAAVYMGVKFMVGYHAAFMVAIGGLVVAAVGFWDDHAHVSAKFRFLVHSLAAAAALAILGGFPIYGVAWGLKAVMTVIYGVAMVWLVNLYNFMDGIDGLAGGEAASVSAAAGLLLWIGGDTDLASLNFVLTAAALGFLAWNRPPAKIFMGDVGSGFLGFAFGALALAAGAGGFKWFAVYAILLSLFWVDATITLIRRVLRGARWYEAHREHAYQYASRRWGHGKVSLAAVVVNLGWLTPWAAVSAHGTETPVWPIIPAVLPIAALCLILGAGRAEKK